MPRMTGDRLIEMQAKEWPPATLSDAFRADIPPEHFAAAEEHFAGFVEPVDDTCIGCGLRLSWAWGFRNGHGSCTGCGYPVQVYHHFGDATLVRVLQPHPADLTIVKES